MLMIGSGFVSAAVIHTASWGPETYCYNYDQPVNRPKTPPIVSSVAAGIGGDDPLQWMMRRDQVVLRQNAS